MLSVPRPPEHMRRPRAVHGRVPARAHGETPRHRRHRLPRTLVETAPQPARFPEASASAPASTLNNMVQDRVGCLGFMLQIDQVDWFGRHLARHPDHDAITRRRPCSARQRTLHRDPARAPRARRKGPAPNGCPPRIRLGQPCRSVNPFRLRSSEASGSKTPSTKHDLQAVQSRLKRRTFHPHHQTVPRVTASGAFSVSGRVYFQYSSRRRGKPMACTRAKRRVTRASIGPTAGPARQRQFRQPRLRRVLHQLAAAPLCHLRQNVGIAVVFDLKRQFRPARFHDLAVRHDMHDIRT